MQLHDHLTILEGFSPGEIADWTAQAALERQALGKAVAIRRANRHELRRANAQAQLASILPATFTPGESWHVISRGDIDSLSYVRHVLQGVEFIDHLLLSTWCIARNDLEEIRAWLDTGRVDQFDLYAGEIFPSQYGDEYELMTQLCNTYGCRLVIARNHSKVTLMSQPAEGLYIAIESSANVNTNPRIEQSAIHCDQALHAFHLEFFAGIKTIDRATRHAAASPA